jgi:hypothetical protein
VGDLLAIEHSHLALAEVADERLEGIVVSSENLEQMNKKQTTIKFATYIKFDIFIA